MSDRHIHGLHAAPGSQHRSDHPPAPGQRNLAAGRFAEVSVRLTDQDGFGDADRRQIEQYPQVARHAEAARVADPVPVHQHQVGPLGQLGEGVQQRRRLAEGEQARHVGQGRRPARPHGGDHAQARHRDQHGGSKDPLARVLARVAAIQPGGEADRAVAHGLVLGHHARGEQALDIARLRGRGRVEPLGRYRRHVPGACGIAAVITRRACNPWQAGDF